MAKIVASKTPESVDEEAGAQKSETVQAGLSAEDEMLLARATERNAAPKDLTASLLANSPKFGKPAPLVTDVRLASANLSDFLRKIKEKYKENVRVVGFDAENATLLMEMNYYGSDGGAALMQSGEPTGVVREFSRKITVNLHQRIGDIINALDREIGEMH